jgi:hypothetical protein
MVRLLRCGVPGRPALAAFLLRTLPDSRVGGNAPASGPGACLQGRGASDRRRPCPGSGRRRGRVMDTRPIARLAAGRTADDFRQEVRRSRRRAVAAVRAGVDSAQVAEAHWYHRLAVFTARAVAWFEGLCVRFALLLRELLTSPPMPAAPGIAPHVPFVPASSEPVPIDHPTHAPPTSLELTVLPTRGCVPSLPLEPTS